MRRKNENTKNTRFMLIPRAPVLVGVFQTRQIACGSGVGTLSLRTGADARRYLGYFRGCRAAFSGGDARRHVGVGDVDHRVASKRPSISNTRSAKSPPCEGNTLKARATVLLAYTYVLDESLAYRCHLLSSAYRVSPRRQVAPMTRCARILGKRETLNPSKNRVLPILFNCG